MRSRLTRQPQYPARIDWSNPITQGLEFAALPIGNTYVDCVTGEVGTATGVEPVTAWPLNDGATTTPHALAAAGTNAGATQILWPVSLSRGGSIAGASAQGTILALGGRATTSNGLTPLLANTEIVTNGNGFSLWLDDYAFVYQGAVIRGDYADPVRYSGQILSTGSIPVRNKLLFFGFAFDSGGANGDWLGNRRSQAWSGESFLVGPVTTNRRARLLTPGYNDGSLNTTGFVALGLIWSRRLSVVEYQSLYDNPWQIFGRALRRAVVHGAAPQSYTLTAAAGTFTLSGQSAGLTVARRLVAAQGVFSLVGQQAGIGRSFALTAATGAFGVTGQVAGLRSARRIAAGTGSFSLTGGSAGLKVAHRVTAGSGAFSLQGQAADFRIAGQIIADVGAFSITGIVAGLRVAHRLSAAAAAFSVTGQAATLVRALRLTAGTGAFSLIGQDAALNVAGSSTLAAETGVFALSGQAAGLRAARRLAAEPGSFSLAGQAAGMRVAHLLSADAGTFVLGGQAAGLSAARQLIADAGAFDLQGHGVAFETAGQLAAGTGAFVLTGEAVALQRAYRLIAAPGEFALTGEAAGLLALWRLLAETGDFELVGQDALFGLTGGSRAETGVFVLTGHSVLLRAVLATLPGRIGGLRRPVVGGARPSQIGRSRSPQRI